eukprot:c133_g1_i1.p1 GENE.c133_g1_i1~~c133_g1_i1.p1  ORF type:complete len:469 (+),score=80.85 c133_g1_i1:27-1409(+)
MYEWGEQKPMREYPAIKKYTKSPLGNQLLKREILVANFGSFMDFLKRAVCDLSEEKKKTTSVYQEDADNLAVFVSDQNSSINQAAPFLAKPLGTTVAAEPAKIKRLKVSIAPKPAIDNVATTGQISLPRKLRVLLKTPAPVAQQPQFSAALPTHTNQPALNEPVVNQAPVRPMEYVLPVAQPPPMAPPAVAPVRPMEYVQPVAQPQPPPPMAPVVNQAPVRPMEYAQPVAQPQPPPMDSPAVVPPPQFFQPPVPFEVLYQAGLRDDTIERAVQQGMLQLVGPRLVSLASWTNFPPQVVLLRQVLPFDSRATPFLQSMSLDDFIAEIRAAGAFMFQVNVNGSMQDAMLVTDYRELAFDDDAQEPQAPPPQPNTQYNQPQQLYPTQQYGQAPYNPQAQQSNPAQYNPQPQPFNPAQQYAQAPYNPQPQQFNPAQQYAQTPYNPQTQQPNSHSQQPWQGGGLP